MGKLLHHSKKPKTNVLWGKVFKQFVMGGFILKWNGFTPIVELVETVYPKGVKLSAAELKPFAEQWLRSETLPKWDITIVPI